MGRWFLIFGIIILIALIVLGAWALPARGNDTKYDTAVITVHYGDTLTGYARQYAPGMPVRDYIDEVKRINRMTDGMIYAGDEIVILKEAER